MNTRKVAIIYHILGHYRKPIFRHLCQQSGNVQYTLFSDSVNTLDTVKPIDSQLAGIPVEKGGLRWKFLKNFKIAHHFLWQKGILKLGISREFDVIVYLGNIYYISTWISAILARLTGKRVLMWSHGFLRNERGFKDWLRKRFYKLAHGMLLYHNRGREIMIQKGFDPQSLYVVYNSLDYDTQRKVRTDIKIEEQRSCREKLFKVSNLPILYFIGRLTPQKRLSMIIEAAKLLKSQNIECNILFVGDGPEKENLEKQASLSGLAGNLCLFGACYDEKEIALMTSVSDVCVAPGEIGLTCMHSLAYGLPVVTHNNPDFQMPEYEAIKPGLNGAFFEKDSVLSLAETIRNWLSKNSDREAVARQCYEVIEQCYNPYYQIKVINAAVLGQPVSQVDGI